MPRLRPFRSAKPDDSELTAEVVASPHKKKEKPNPASDRGEALRLWILRELVDSYHFPESWIGDRIVANRIFSIDGKEAVPSVCILTQWGDPFVVIETNTEASADDSEALVKSVLSGSRIAAFGMNTNGTLEGTRFYRKRTNPLRFEYVPDLDVFNRQVSARTYKVKSVGRSSKDKGTTDIQLQPLSEGIENLLFEAHSHIRDIDGLHADEAFDELCKILYSKLYDEQHACEHGRPKLQRGLYGSMEEFAASVRRVYKDAGEQEQRVLEFNVPEYVRSRAVFTGEINLSSAALTKIIEMLQEYDLGGSEVDIRGRAFQRILSPSVRSGMGQYLTPDAVIRFMVSVIEPTPNALILDPFCGSAGFLSGALRFVQEKNPDISTKEHDEFVSRGLHGIEKSERMVRIAMTAMRIQGDGHSNIRCADSLLPFENYPDIRAESFDVVLTNPPFGSVLPVEALSALASFETARGRKSVPLEVLGLERCIHFLTPGGKLAIVLPDGVFVNRSYAYVRRLVDAKMRIEAIVSLPIQTFTPFGAAVKTCVMFARKWKHGERTDKNYDIFLGRLDNIGYDGTGRNTDGQEFDKMTSQLKDFLEKEGW